MRKARGTMNTMPRSACPHRQLSQGADGQWHSSANRLTNMPETTL